VIAYQLLRVYIVGSSLFLSMDRLPLLTALDSGVMPLAAGGAADAPGCESPPLEQLHVALAKGIGGHQHISAVYIRPPTAQEFQNAIRAGSDALEHATDDTTRALLLQHDVLLRHHLSQRSSVLSSGSGHSLTTSTGSSTFDSPRDPPSSLDVGVTDGAVIDGVTGFIVIHPSPAKVFRCPLCPAVLSEKDFARHIDTWLSRDATGDTKRLRRNQCPGIPLNHAYLQRFVAEGSHREQVRCLHATVRAMLRPGCGPAQTPQGSGNHLAVEAFFRSLGMR
jgi:hypothetical protein